MDYDVEPGNQNFNLIEVAREAKRHTHNPYGEAAEGAAVLAHYDDEAVAIPGVLIENGNYTNTRAAAETAIFNAVNLGYNDIDRVAISRDEERARPIRNTTQAVTEEFLQPDTPLIIDTHGKQEIYAQEDLETEQSQLPSMDTAFTVPEELGEPYTIDEDDSYDDTLVDIAREQMDDAYVPVSRYNVGAALLDEDGVVHPGNNIENTEKRAVGHGEETAIMHWKTFSDADPVAMAVASRDGGNCCGYCKQWMAEFFPDDTIVTNVSDDDTVTRTYGDIDPFPFRFDTDA